MLDLSKMPLMCQKSIASQSADLPGNKPQGLESSGRSVGSSCIGASPFVSKTRSRPSSPACKKKRNEQTDFVCARVNVSAYHVLRRARSRQRLAVSHHLQPAEGTAMRRLNCLFCFLCSHASSYVSSSFDNSSARLAASNV